MKVRVGELESVPIREVWPDEARDLTPWLADNLDALGSALGMGSSCPLSTNGIPGGVARKRHRRATG